MGGDKLVLKYFRGVASDLRKNGCVVFRPTVSRFFKK